MKIKRIALFAVILLAATLSTADDKGPHDGAIEARQALMQVYKFNLLNLRQMEKGKAEYNAETATIAADNLLAAISMKQAGMWPKGSHSKDSVNRKNAALPALWEASPDKIAKASKAMADAATQLQAVAGNGLDELKGAMGPVYKGCKGCHDDFRAKAKKK